MNKRKEIMRELKAKAIVADCRYDVVLRQQAIRAWQELATTAELKRAPKWMR